MTLSIIVLSANCQVPLYWVSLYWLSHFYMLSVVMLNVSMLSVVAPRVRHFGTSCKTTVSVSFSKIWMISPPPLFSHPSHNDRVDFPGEQSNSILLVSRNASNLRRHQWPWQLQLENCALSTLSLGTGLHGNTFFFFFLGQPSFPGKVRPIE